MPPISCGYDQSTGEDQFCCADSDSGVNQLQRPLFPSPRDGSNPRECMDHTTHCERWAKNNPESCQAGNPGYPFMRETCHKSCGRCETKVTYLSKNK